MNADGLSYDLIQDPQQLTICKLRVLSQSQQLMRLDFECSYQSADKTALHQAFERKLAEADIVLISDYGKGTLSEVPYLIDLCQAHHVPVLIDPKGEDYHKYRGASLITPNKKEFELVMGPCDTKSVLEQKAQQMLEQYQLDSLLVTQGSEGMTLFRRDEQPYHLPAQAKSMYDVTGAGDTVIGVLSACLAAKLKIEQAIQLANYAASIVVGQVGASTVTVEDLKQHSEASHQGLSLCRLNNQIKQHQLL